MCTVIVPSVANTNCRITRTPGGRGRYFVPQLDRRGRDFETRLDGLQQAKQHGRGKHCGSWLDEKQKGTSNCFGREQYADTAVYI